jgi:hypothetical protein
MFFYGIAMAQVTSGIRSLLSSPIVYTAFQNLMGARQGWVDFVQEFIRVKAGEALLDVGCGPADISCRNRFSVESITDRAWQAYTPGCRSWSIRDE